MANAKKVVKEREKNGSLAVHSESFVDLEACFADEPLTPENLFERESAFKDSRGVELRQLQRDIEPTRTKLLNAMARFLQNFPDERADLQPQVEYLDSFLELGEHISAKTCLATKNGSRTASTRK